MADPVPILGVRTSDEGVCRNLHVAGRLGDSADFFVAIAMVPVMCVDNAIVNIIQQGLECAGRTLSRAKTRSDSAS